MPLNKKEVESYKERLLKLKEQITKTFQGSAAEVKTPDEATGYSQHQADEGTDDFDRTINIEISGKEQAILKLIDRALDKVEENTYGICDVTGEDIPTARLDAVPYATMTVKAQEQVEKGLI